MFEVKCNGRLLCISPTYRGAEKYVKNLKKQGIYNYEIIEEELEI